MTNSYSGDEAFREFRSGPPSPADTLDMGAQRRTDSIAALAGRHTLQKHHSTTDADTVKGFKRFSKRQSKSGLAAVF